MKFNMLSSLQLFVMSVMIALISSLAVSTSMLYREYRMLPLVVQAPDGTCIKVVNYENGHAFSCHDVNVLLRQFRTEIDQVK